MENKTFTTPEAQQEAREQARAQRNKKIFIFSSIAILVILVVAGAVYFLHAFDGSQQHCRTQEGGTPLKTCHLVCG